MRRRTDNDDADDNIVRDGETVSVRVNLVDTIRFDQDGRERFVRMADARRKKPPDDDDDDGDNDTTDAADIDVRDYQPGYRLTTDAACAKARAARQEMIDRACNAWRRQPQQPQQPQRAMHSRDAAEPDLGSSPEAMRRHMYGAPGLPAASDPDVDSATTMRGHMGELFERSQRQRDRAWGSYRDQLTNAWRGGRTDPRRAAQVEGLQERWRHGRDGATE
jgi:hypothetical protein